MDELNDKDWELVNAYHDGELGDTERQALESRLLSEPALKKALADVASVSASLGALRPDTQRTTQQPPIVAANENQRLSKWLVGGTVAAAITLATALGPQIFSEPSAFDIHSDFAAQTITIEGGNVRPVAVLGSPYAPDLGSANLTPIAMRQVKDGHVIHYAGRNGCRLSYFRGTFSLGEQNPTSENQVAEWSTANNVHHMILATGMDQNKFNAIAAYLLLSTRQQAVDQMMASLVETTASADRCVG